MDRLAAVEKKIEQRKLALKRLDKVSRSLVHKYHAHIFCDALQQAGWQRKEEWSGEEFSLLVGFLCALKCRAISETDRRLYLHFAAGKVAKKEGED
ncbi:hypothetical protein SAMN04488499_100387 [Sporomusa acidovorans]|nr:hypothetical protein [Sporomusa acidovorans]OZC19141.1 hypothetical protein SPACI_32270 [Sporomusa acidovorans DSM 3132]SDD68686.1 hypothetical protein SAMN04488499_100387 [Sporomusa acidovorans]